MILFLILFLATELILIQAHLVAAIKTIKSFESYMFSPGGGGAAVYGLYRYVPL